MTKNLLFSVYLLPNILKPIFREKEEVFKLLGDNFKVFVLPETATESALSGKLFLEIDVQ